MSGAILPSMMPTTFEQAFALAQPLVINFRANERYYLSSDYQEVAVRKDFIDKFFIALGWDVNHDTQRNPYEQEVKVERSEGSSKRRADYTFRVAPTFSAVWLFVEAKKTFENLATAAN